MAGWTGESKSFVFDLATSGGALWQSVLVGQLTGNNGREGFKKKDNKLGLSCAKLSTALGQLPLAWSYPLAGAA